MEIIDVSAGVITYEYVIENVGNAPAGLDGPTGADADNVSVQAFLSRDPIFNNQDDFAAGATILGSSPLGVLRPGETFVGTSTVDRSLAEESHPFLTLKIDWGEVVDESNEQNNTASVRLPDVAFSNRIFDIQFDPLSPAALLNDEDVNLSFSYTTDVAEGVRITAHPFTNGQASPGQAFAGSPLHPAPGGDATKFFTILNGTVHVDQVRLQMWTDGQTELLFETFVDVDYQFDEVVANRIFDIQFDPVSPGTCSTTRT